MPDPLSVSQMVAQIKEKVEFPFRSVSVRGEISNLTYQRSGHIYFTLKDTGSQLPAVIFKGNASGINFRLKEGLQVVCRGRINLYEPHGKIQLVARIIEADGIGRLQQKFEELKAKMLEEGLFDSDRKQPVPSIPQRLVVISSPTGAAIQDFFSVLQREGYRGRAVLLPVSVQGENAPPEIVHAIQIAHQLKLGDLIVLTRGGGSIEDLWAFNTESTVRAIAASTIPIISAVGHETDTTLSDLAADVRAETPTAAAAGIARRQRALLDRMDRARDRIQDRACHAIERARLRLQVIRSKLDAQSPRNRLENAWLRLDEFSLRLQRATSNRLQDSKVTLEFLRQRLHLLHPSQKLLDSTQRLATLRLRLQQASHHSALERGFALISNPYDGKVVSSVRNARSMDSLQIQLKDGHLRARPEMESSHFDC